MAKYTLTSYEGIDVTLPKPEVPDHIIDQKIKELVEPLAEYHEVSTNRPATMGDYVVVSTEDACVNGRTASNFALQHSLYHIGGGEMPQTFDDAIRGMAPGETRDVVAKIKLPFAQDDDDLADLTMTVHLEKVLYRIDPKLDDNLVKEHFAPATTVQEFREGVAKQFTLPNMSPSDPQLPDILLAELAKRLVEEPAEEDYIEGMPYDALRETCAIDALADHLGIELSEEQVIAQMPGESAEQRTKVYEQMKGQGLADDARRFACREAALSWLANNSTVSYEQ